MSTITYFPTTGGLPSGTGIVKVTAGVGAVATEGTDYIIGDWFSLQSTRVRAISSSFMVPPVVRSEGLNISTELELSAAANANQGPLSTSTGGVMHLATGAGAGTTTGILRNRDGAAGTPSTFVNNSRTGLWAICTRAKIVTTPVNTGFIPMCNLLDTTTDIYLGCRGATSVANLVVTTNAGPVDTTVALDTTAFHDYALVNDGTNLNAYVDGTLIYTIAVGTKIATTAGYLRLFNQNGATGGNQESYFDKIAVFTAQQS